MENTITNKDTPKGIFYGLPWKVEETDIPLVKDNFKKMIEQSPQLKGSALYVLENRKLHDVLKELCDIYDLRLREEKIDWALKDKGQKPLAEAMKKAVRRCDYLICIEIGDESNWMRNYLERVALEEHLICSTRKITKGEDTYGEES